MTKKNVEIFVDKKLEDLKVKISNHNADIQNFDQKMQTSLKREL